MTLSSSMANSPLFTLGDWDNKACVRTRKSNFLFPSKRELELELESKYWFPPTFMPYLQHPLTVNTDKKLKQRLTANHLIHFLDYTTVLEHKIVNRSVETIIHGELQDDIPESMKSAALQLYTDEGYHAYFSYEIAKQVSEYYCIQSQSPRPLRITLLLDLIDRVETEHKPLAWFLIGFVSETIIAKELLNVTCNTIISSVYQILRQHLEDEARHSRFFADAFCYFWQRLEANQQLLTVELLKNIILIFSEVDEPWLTESLLSTGFSTSQIRTIIYPLLNKSTAIQRIRVGATPTFLAMKKAGVFDNKHNKLPFKEAGLIDD
ncbi:diiron oxygenase [Pseudomonas gingeri]|uniref:Diiron oxygenase n=1 Tax=Pseudomonas gingeri TaxID=117681 RepID=A0A7Y7WT30_9PSED|nr:diiron oxygenase [Pseudomonas gingeri]NWB86187.1 diiron oxygenase [Pseudomonas gingeri]